MENKIAGIEGGYATTVLVKDVSSRISQMNRAMNQAVMNRVRLTSLSWSGGMTQVSRPTRCVKHRCPVRMVDGSVGYVPLLRDITDDMYVDDDDCPHCGPEGGLDRIDCCSPCTYQYHDDEHTWRD